MHDIYFQIVNSFNKNIMIVTKRGLIIPVKENIIIDKVPKISIEKFIEKNKAIDINKLEKLIDEFNNLPKITSKMSIKGIIKGRPELPKEELPKKIKINDTTSISTDDTFDILQPQSVLLLPSLQSEKVSYKIPLLEELGVNPNLIEIPFNFDNTSSMSMNLSLS